MLASTTKKAKKTGQQPVSKPSATDATPSKTMKRKKEESNDNTLEAPSVSASKKLKKDTVTENSKQLNAAREKAVPVQKEQEQAKADSKKKSKPTVESTTPKANMKEPAAPSEVKDVKSKSKPKDASNPEPPAPATTKAKETLKKATKSAAMPTSISRPKNTQKSKTSARSKPSKSSSPEPEADGAQDSDEGELLHGFSTDDDDSSEDEDAMDVEPSDFDVAKLPTIAKDDATVKRKLEKAKKQPTEDRGVLFLGRLPHGFYEDQLKAYFSQFGEVTRLRVSRNKKTGASKHYGFIEFGSSAVAQIVAETMDNYLLMGHILRCKIIPKDQVHPELWVGANRKWRPVPKARLARVHHNKPRTEEEQGKAAKRLLKRQEQRKQKLAKAGIDYDFDAVSYKKPVTA